MNINKEISIEYLEKTISNPKIPDKIRAAYCNLCRVIFIDVNPYIRISRHESRCYIMSR